MPYLKRVDRKTKKELTIVVDTEACYFKNRILENKNEFIKKNRSYIKYKKGSVCYVERFT